MKRVSLAKSLRFKLVLASILVETGMLLLLVQNSVRVMENHMVEQAQIRLEEVEPLLNTSLAKALAERDYGTMDDVLNQVRRQQGISYLVLFDNYGKTVAAAGWPRNKPLPPLSRQLDDSEGIYSADIPMHLAGEAYGKLRFGISTRFLTEGKASVQRQGLAIAAAAILLSFVLLDILEYWLTRHLGLLTEASRAVAKGNFDIRLPVRTDDEVGQLTQSFNVMADAVCERIQALSEGEAKFHAIADYTFDWELWNDPQGKLIWVNSSVERMTGYTPEECLAMKDFLPGIALEEDVEQVRQEFRRTIQGHAGSNFEFRVRCKDASIFWAAANWQSIYGAAGEYLGVRTSIRDITSLKKTELELRRALDNLKRSEETQRQYLGQVQDEQARLVALLSAMNIGILFVSVDNRVIYYNPAFLRIWMIRDDISLSGKAAEEVLNYSTNLLARPDHFSKHMLEVLGTHEVSDSFEIHMADGRIATQFSHPVRDKDGRFIGRLWLYEDVTRERQTAEQLIYLAERDSLTGLYNRHRFQQELGRVVAESRRYHSQGALLFFDLDEFKYINDTFGHRAGDAMLIRVAAEVGTLVRRNEVFSRLGGDEFAILVPDAGEREAETLAERVVRAISQIPFRFEDHNLRLTTSLGIALFPKHADNEEELIAHADTAMYQAKEAGKNAWRAYRQDLDASREMVNRLSWNERISHALDNGLMRPHFQGIYNTRDGSLSHLEVLVRMVDESHPDRLVMPGHFIGFAEKSGKILEIDRWMLRESISLLARIEGDLSLAVNISARSLDDPTLPQFIAEQLRDFRVAPARLLVELTETAAISDLQDAERFIEALHRTGCRICLDDFGTGFSSFAYLKHLKADILKIDGLFIRDLPNDRDNQVFVKSIVDVARGMGKVTIAEFVEDAETLEMLKRFGVDMVQGYHLDMPQHDHPAVRAAQPDGGRGRAST